MKTYVSTIRSVNDQRFSWPPNVFLKFYQDFCSELLDFCAEFCLEKLRKLWKRSWPENVDIVERQTYEGLKISFNSIIEATQFILWHQVKYVLTERFCQCPLEYWFGRQGSLESRKDNPSMTDFSYSNAITTQKISNHSLMVMLLIVTWLP